MSGVVVVEEGNVDGEKFSALTDEEQGAFDSLQAMMRGDLPGRQVCLMRVQHEGVDRAVVCCVEPDGEDGVMVWPMALLMDDALFKGLSPSGEPETVT